MQPIGAVDQHGPHLPLVADSLVVEAVATRLEQATDVALLPTLAYGKSNEHEWAPGTIVLSTTTLIGLLTDIGRSIHRMGARTLVFLNGHGGNTAVLSTVARDLHVELGLLTYVVHPFLAYAGTSDVDPLDFHAGHSETSVVLHLDPELVHTDRLESNVTDAPGRHVGLVGSVGSAGAATSSATAAARSATRRPPRPTTVRR